MKMQSRDKIIPLVVILGATAVGKTEAAIDLAEEIGGEIISADSRLFYKGMNVGTAKPTARQLKRVRHHLIDVASPDDTWNLAKFSKKGAEAINEIYSRGKIPILVGGTGQYLRAIIEGWEIPEVPPNEKLREAIEKWSSETSVEGLHARLQCLDGEAAASMDARNLRRITRALEVIFTTGKKFSGQRLRKKPPYEVFQIGLKRSRDEIYERIDQRIDSMIRSGFLEEVRSLMAEGYSSELPSFSAIGYKQIANYLQMESSLDEAIVEIKRLTRKFVRRQGNWFKDDDPSITWVDMNGETTATMAKLTQEFLKNREIIL